MVATTDVKRKERKGEESKRKGERRLRRCVNLMDLFLALVHVAHCELLLIFLRHHNTTKISRD
jgi:hypothetical protein